MPWRNPATATEGIMWGRVSDARTGLYVDDATVTVTGGPTVKTDGNGYYVATLIPATAGGTVRTRPPPASPAWFRRPPMPPCSRATSFAMTSCSRATLPRPSQPSLPTQPASGPAVTLTATVTGTRSTGTVEFFDGATSLGTATLSGGSATRSVDPLGRHPQQLPAAYFGDGANSSSTSSARSVTVNSPPTISAQPTPATELRWQFGDPSETAANATAYQWRKEGTNIDGATLSDYTINPVGTNDAASYDCVVSGASPCASVTSSSATLAVLQPPVITTQPYTLAAVPGGNAAFSVSAVGSEPLFYQWYQGPTNGLPLAGRTTAALILTNLQPADFTNYTAVVANSCGSAASAARRPHVGRLTHHHLARL